MEVYCRRVDGTHPVTCYGDTQIWASQSSALCRRVHANNPMHEEAKKEERKIEEERVRAQKTRLENKDSSSSRLENKDSNSSGLKARSA